MPGVSAPRNLPGQGELLSAVGSMNHVAFHVPADKFEGYRRRLEEKGVAVSPILNHDDSPYGVSREMYDGVFVRSLYFQDPDGILLKLACWPRAEVTDERILYFYDHLFAPDRDPGYGSRDISADLTGG